MFRLPKYFSRQKATYVMILKTGHVGRVLKCERHGSHYLYQVNGDDNWWFEKELKEIMTTKK